MSTIEQLEVRGSHLQVGLTIGERFSAQIHWALDSYTFLQERILPYHRTLEGQARYRDVLRLHAEHCASYLSELEGLAEGAGRPFEELFLVNMRGEYTGYLRSQAHGCADCAVVTDEAALFGHNEDASPAFRGNLYIVHAQIVGVPAFTALSYPGFLCGNAFGFNAEGICFSVDDVQPQKMRVGIGRHFIARSLLESRSLDDAIERVTVAGRASGFSYTIGSIPERRIVHVEVAPEVHRLRQIRRPYFHANHYLELDSVDQVIHPSSRARVERADALLRRVASPDAGDILSILGDRADEQYPIYRTATPPDRLMTLCTALFDLDARRLQIHTDHPTQNPDAVIEFAL
jgi:hypothetical protein